MKVKVSCQSPLAGVGGGETPAPCGRGSSKKLFLCRHTALPSFVSGRYLSGISLFPFIHLFFTFHMQVALTLPHVLLAVGARCFSNAHTVTCDCYFCQMSCWPLSPELRKRTAYHNGAQRSKMLMEGRPCTDPPVSIDAPSSVVTLQTRAFTKMCPLPLSCFFFFFTPCTHF